MDRRAIVIDKNFLQGTKTTQMHKIAMSHRLLMTEALFYEILSNSKERHLCFAKFPQIQNSVDFVMHLGWYLSYEIKQYKPTPKPSDAIHPEKFKFNEQLLSLDYQLRKSDEMVLKKWQGLMCTDIDFLIQNAKDMPGIFPNIFQGSDLERKEEKYKTELTIANDKEKLLNFYDNLHPPDGERPYPPKEYLSEEWAIYRWIQVQQLFSLDLAYRYFNSSNEQLTPKIYEKIEHDVLDAEYLILGVLEGAFATCEKKLIRWFKLICPNGFLLNK